MRCALGGEFYESFAVNSKNCREHSEGTRFFIAGFDRFLNKCIRAAARPPRAPVREAFELLFGLRSRIDAGEDVVFFAGEAGSWQLGVDWGKVLPAYSHCLAESTSPPDYRRIVDQVIAAFAEHDRA